MAAWAAIGSAPVFERPQKERGKAAERNDDLVYRPGIAMLVRTSRSRRQGAQTIRRSRRRMDQGVADSQRSEDSTSCDTYQVTCHSAVAYFTISVVVMADTRLA